MIKLASTSLSSCRYHTFATNQLQTCVKEHERRLVTFSVIAKRNFCRVLFSAHKLGLFTRDVLRC